jgi:hypothetical protein
MEENLAAMKGLWKDSGLQITLINKEVGWYGGN